MSPDLVLTRDQVRRVDEMAQSKYGLAGIVLMENAGRGAAELIDRMYGPHGQTLIACGTGNNGGDGLVIARHLHILGWQVRVLVAGNAESMSPDCAANDRIVRAMGLPHLLTSDGSLPEGLLADRQTIIVDALLGTGFRGEVRHPFRALIDQMNSLPRRAMVAVDIPSGLDCDTGIPGGTAIKADTTITFVALKPGLLTEAGRRYSGQCHVAGIGVPPELVEFIRNS